MNLCTPSRRRRRTSALCVCLGLVAMALSAGCTGCKSEEASGASSHRSGARELVVFAAASLTDAFGDVEKAFEAEHPGIDVVISFAGSQSLRTQIEQGASPQVFASANAKHMQALADAGRVGPPVPFTRNRLVVVTPPDNPSGIESFGDLARAKRLVLAGVNVPVGAYAARAIDSATTEYGEDFGSRVESAVVSRETHVRQALHKVVLGEADASIVYATDAAAAGEQVRVVEIPDQHNVQAEYPIAVAGGSELGQQFVDYIGSDAGKSILNKHGFR